jgi:hypothetical protein
MGIGKFWMKHGPGSLGSLAKNMTKCYIVNKESLPSYSNEQLLALTLESRIQAQFQTKKINALQPCDEEGKEISELELVQKHNWDLKELILYVAHCEIPEVDNACLKLPDLYQVIIEIIDEVVNKYLSHEDALYSDSKNSNRVLSVSQVQSMPYISIRTKEVWGFFGYSMINHGYEKKPIGKDNLVIDNATGLIWHQSGSGDEINWYDAKEWVRSLNIRGYAGYNDWRLPMVEEAVSLLESNKKSSNLYIDTIFDRRQSSIWTGDESDAAGYTAAAWSVDFINGLVEWSNSLFYVRPVRSMK